MHILLLLAQLTGVGGIGNGPALPATCSPGDVFVINGTPTLNICTTTNVWSQLGWASGGTIPQGLITLVNTGACPSGWTEVSALNGKMLRGTIASNANVGTTGGSDTITPAGTNGTGTVTPLGTIAWPAGVPTFAGDAFSSIINHTHPITDPGHNHTQNSFAPRIINSGTAGTVGVQGASGASNANASNSATTATNQSNTTGVTTTNPAGGVSSITPTGTISWPAGVSTLSGSSSVTSAPTFTGTQFDNRPAYTNVIFCSKD